MSTSASNDFVRLNDVGKVYYTSEIETHALSQVDVAIARGEFLSIIGPSGSGKTTLLNVLGLIEPATSGQMTFDGVDVSRWRERDITQLRAQRVGYVFQSFFLVERLTVFENVALALRYRKLSSQQVKTKVEAALESLGMSHRARHLPQQLSGGQQQRVAIARAIVGEPQLILADEPTGNLDVETGSQVLDILCELNANGCALVLVTHDAGIASRAERCLRMLNGRVADCRSHDRAEVLTGVGAFCLDPDFHRGDEALLPAPS